MRKNSFAGLVVAVVLTLSLASCKDTKTLQENEQLKAQVSELQKENGQLGNSVETMTSERDALAKENQSLKARSSARQAKPVRRKTTKKKRRA